MGPKVVLDPADFNYIDRNNEEKKSFPQRNKSHQDLFFSMYISEMHFL